MESYEQVMKAIYDAIGHVNRSLPPDQAIERSPETVLIGGEGLESVHLLDLIVGIEENIERIFRKTISVIDSILLAEEPDRLTVDALAQRIVRLLSRPPRD